MSAIARFILPPDVSLTPADEILRGGGSRGGGSRAGVTRGAGEFIIDRPGARIPGSLVDAEGAQLLDLFRRPITMAEALVEHAKRRGVPAETALEECYDFLRQCVNGNLLVVEGSPAALPVIARLQAGATIGGVRIARSIRVAMDTEVYETRTSTGRRRCLKIARLSDIPSIAAQIQREAEVLRRVGGVIAPTLYENGRHDGCDYILMAWQPGVMLDSIARHAVGGGTARRLELARAIVSSYATLHRAGVIHGDVNPTNVIVNGRSRVAITDFALSRIPGVSLMDSERGAAAFFQDPAFAEALATGAPHPPPDFASDQYSLGAMLYFLFTGRYYLDFAADQSTTFEQISRDAPMSFAERGCDPWPAVEAVLSRMLAKRAADRFVSLEDAAAALTAIRAPVRRCTQAKARPSSDFSEQFVRRAALDHAARECGRVMPASVSLHVGAAGVSLSLYRIACSRDDAEILAEADVWSVRARHAMNESRPYDGVRERLRASQRSSLYHGRSGAHLARAFVAHALGDLAGCSEAAGDFVSSITLSQQGLDVVGGLSGALIGCSLLADLPGLRGAPSRARLATLGDRLAAAVSRRTQSPVPVSAAGRRPLGMAHGWAGFLYAVMRWHEVNERPLPSEIVDRLNQLGACGVRAGSALRWLWTGDPHATGRGVIAMPGWCNGGTGYVFLWRLASDLTHEARFEQLALGAARDAWLLDTPARQLCCGAAGRAYAMLAMWRATGSHIWLKRAHHLARHATATAGHPDDEHFGSPDGLMRGNGGISVLVEELSAPQFARMPLVERDCWSQRPAFQDADG